ncbi:MAG TPA: 3-hydroxylacyl-ACP dehydratase [Anaeromyxobacter sp.]
MTFPPVAELLPHGPPMILIDEVVDASEGRVAARVVLRPTSPFVEGDRVPAIVAIEYMAQTIGAYAGLRARAAGGAPRIGFLLGTRELSLEVDAFEVGDELRIEARHVWGDERIGSFQCEVVRAGRTLASALVNVYEGDEEPQP